MNKRKLVEYDFKRLYNLSEDTHNIFTPFELCEEMLNKIPELNKDMKILVMFNLEFVYVLLEKFGRQNMNNIWFMTPCEKKGLIGKAMGLDGNHINIYSYKDNKIEGEENMPKFDVVVGNPPFKGSLYVDFLNISYMISKKYTLFVHPGTIYFNEKANNKQQKEILYKTNILNKIKNIDIIRHTKYFNIALWSPMTITLIDKEYNNSEILINDKIKNTSYYTSINQLNKWGNLNEYYSIKNKILSSLDNLLNHKNSIGKFYVNISLLRGHSYTNDDKLFDDDFYTLIPRTEFIANSPNKGLYFGFNTENEANNFLNYLKCNFTRFSLSLFKFNMNLNRGELKGIPWLDFTQEWSDEKLYKYFNLTQEEINFIETNIPKYYND